MEMETEEVMPNTEKMNFKDSQDTIKRYLWRKNIHNTGNTDKE